MRIQFRLGGERAAMTPCRATWAFAKDLLPERGLPASVFSAIHSHGPTIPERHTLLYTALLPNSFR